MKKLLLGLVFVIMMAGQVFANNVSNLDYYVDINEDGSAYITQIWEGQFTSGTENYIPINCNDFSISEFYVKDSRGIEYKDKGTNWNIDASKDEKAYSYGIHKIGGNEIELCWGIGDYGYTTYEISYKISSLVKRCSDGVDGFNFKFVNDNMSTFPTNLDMKIRMANGKEINENNARIWAFGFDGQDIFQDGEIRVTTHSKLSGSDYVVVCSSLDGLVEPLETNSRSFDEIVSTAKVGSEYQQNNNSGSKGSAKGVIGIMLLGSLFSLMTGIIPFIICLIFVLSIFGKNSKNLINVIYILFGLPFILAGLFIMLQGRDTILFGLIFFVSGFVPMLPIITGVKNKIKWKKFTNGLEYYRGIPKSISESNYIINKFGNLMGVDKENTYIGTLIMKMLLNGNLEAIERENVGIFGRTKKEVDLKFIKEPEDKEENAIYSFLKVASNSETRDNTLQNNELQGFCKKHYVAYDKMMKAINDNAEDNLCKDGKIINKKYAKNIEKGWNEEGKKQIKELAGLKKYFDDFTLLSEREVSEIMNWEMMLVYATLLGVAEKVVEKFKIAMPTEDIERLNNVSVAISMSNVVTKGITSGLASARSSSGSSGHGGHSSSGGGGGHSGGSSGGGSR